MNRRITYEESVNMFVASIRVGLIYGNDRIEPAKVKDILLDKYDKRTVEYRCEIGEECIMQNLYNIMSVRRGKERRYFICSKYIEFINRDERFDVKLDKLPPLYNDLERQLEICKKMHQDEFNLKEMEKEFIVSSRTIQSDLSKLRDGEISVLGQTLQVDYEHMRDNKITMVSTAHPLFLVQNLTQVVVMLNGLLYASNNESEYAKYAENTAINIWMQLSEYAQNRILNELIGTLDLNEKWYRSIAKKANDKKAILESERANECKGHFKNEIEASENNKYLYILKNQEPCTIKYFDEDGNYREIDANYIKTEYVREKVIVCITDEGKISIPLRDIEEFKTKSQK